MTKEKAAMEATAGNDHVMTATQASLRWMSFEGCMETAGLPQTPGGKAQVENFFFDALEISSAFHGTL